MIGPPPISTLFPYTTLFRSHGDRGTDADGSGPADGDGPGDAQGRSAGDGRGDEHRAAGRIGEPERPDRKSTRLNSSHRTISYAVFCLKKKKGRIRTSARVNI